jgi:hypothetical protein
VAMIYEILKVVYYLKGILDEKLMIEVRNIKK